METTYIEKIEYIKKEYLEQQIKGFILILKDNEGTMISREYVEEKLNMILKDGINFHPVIKHTVGMEVDQKVRDCLE